MTKLQLIKSLLKGEQPTKDTYIFSWENMKVSDEIGFFKFEVMDHKEKIIFKIKVQMDMTNPETKKNFQDIAAGASKPGVGLFQIESKNFFSTVWDGVQSAVGEGRVPFLPGS